MEIEAYHLWIAAALLLALGELFIGSYVLLWFAIGAAGTALAAAAGGGLNTQLVVFCVVSLALFTASRTIFRRYLMRRDPRAKTNVPAMVGKTVEVIEKIGPGDRPGTVRVSGELWGAVSDGQVVEVGERVEIVEVIGLKLRVRRRDELVTTERKRGIA